MAVCICTSCFIAPTTAHASDRVAQPSSLYVEAGNYKKSKYKRNKYSSYSKRKRFKRRLNQAQKRSKFDTLMVVAGKEL